jgi:tetratricopeptide (TPR) repeat protein
MEKQIELLTGIHDMMQNPSATQATELFHMGTDSFGRQRYPDALKVLLRARDLNPGDYRVLVTLGHAHVRMEDIPEAAESFEAAVDYARTPGYKHDALLLLSRAHRSLGMVDEAVQRAEQAAALAPDDAAAHYEVAMCAAQRLARS